MSFRLCVVALSLGCALPSLNAQTASATPSREVARDELRFVVAVSRHGVRSPTSNPEVYNRFSTSAWPAWDVPPGFLTEHGFRAIALEGGFDRADMVAHGLAIPAGCAGADAVTIYADSDQRTRETARAYAEGMFPGCGLAIGGRTEGTNDPLFHAPPEAMSAQDRESARQAIAARIHGDAKWPTEAAHTELERLDKVLAGCGAGSERSGRTSIFDVPATLAAGSDDHAAQLKGPLFTAATLSEIFLLEYTQGMPMAEVGWGCVSPAEIRSLIHLHTLAFDDAQRTPAVAWLQGGGLLRTIDAALEQAATGKAQVGSVARPEDKLLLLVGHDTNLANLAGMLGLHWNADGRADDTPPGSALVFELWRSAKTGGLSVKVRFQASTLEQIRDLSPLNAAHPPAGQALPLAGCAGSACTLEEFGRIVKAGR